MAQSASEKAQALLDAQVQFFLQEISPERLQPILEQELEFLYDKLESISLNEAVDQNKVAITAHRYAVDMEIGGAIPELFGEIARQVYELPENETTAVGDIINQDIAEELLEKIFERNSLLDQAVNTIRGSETFQTFLSDVAFTVLKSYIFEKNKIVKTAPPVAKGIRAISDLISNRTPGLKDAIESQTRTALQGTISSSLTVVHDSLDNDLYRDSALNSTLSFWDEIRSWPLSYFRNYVTEMDLQELLVLGYEFWLDFRHTDYLKSCIDNGVNVFFEKFGEENLQALISELGVTKEMIISEPVTYAPDISKLLIEHELAETILRRHLERFYFSESTLAMLEPES